MKSWRKLLNLCLLAILFTCISCNDENETPINQEIEAQFEVNNVKITIGSSITFIDESIGNPTKWLWVFEGPVTITSTDKNPTILFENIGTYDVTLVASNDESSDQITKKDFIEVSQGINTQFEANLLKAVEGSSIIFTDKSSGNPTNWLWKFEGPVTITSSEKNPTILFETIGFYNVTLTASNNISSDELTINNFIEVIPEYDQGLLGYYPFNGNANDESGNNNHGEVFGSTTLSNDRNGISNAAYNFNGINDYIKIPYLSEISTGQITVATWIEPFSLYTGSCQQNYIIGNSTVENGLNEGIWFLSYSDNWLDNGNCDNFDANNHTFVFRLDFMNNNPIAILSTTKVSINNTYFVVATYDGNSMKLYINGKLETQIEVNKSLKINQSTINIGKDFFSESHPFNVNGKIDDIRIYDRSLTIEEIDQLYNL